MNDKKSIFAFLLIGVVLIAWLYWTSSSQKNQPPPPKKDSTELVKKDSVTGTKTITPDTVKTASDTTKKPADSLGFADLRNKFGNIFYNKSVDYTTQTAFRPESIVKVETGKAIMEFTGNGGTLKTYYPKGFKTWDGHPVQLVDWKKDKELYLLFLSKDGKTINTNELTFEPAQNTPASVNIADNKDFQLRYELNLAPDGSQKIIKIYKFKQDSYEFDVEFEFVNSDRFISGSKYQVVWGSSLNLTEFRSDNEATYSEAFAYMGGELETLDATAFDESYNADLNGNTDYVSSRNKYFGIFIVPQSRKGDGAYLEGKKFPLKDEGMREEYSIAVKMDIKNDASQKDNFSILLTPLDYNILKSYNKDFELTMRFTLDFLVRPIAQYVILPFFNFLHKFIPNYGIVIIVFALVMKIVLNPLTKKQTESMKKMSQLSPKMNAIREKYKDDPVKANQQIMQLYKDEKINPAGGCLPMLLQLPILYALFGVFQSTIELRQQPFMLWIHDLSAPDVIFHLPFKIPIFGIDQVSGLAVLMGVTMIVQQKMTVTDPKQKAMVYIMPIMLTLLFFSFPAGLNLYYFVFNLLSIAQQWWTNRNAPKEEVVVMDSKSNKPAGGGPKKKLQKK
jgi:YidC/Oxa1 family membrane protein insertase